MVRMVYLLLFLIKNYWRRTHFILQFFTIALFCGYLLDYRYAPYSYDYVVLVKNIALIIVALITTFQLNKINYDRSIYVLLNRVTRRDFYLVSIFSSFTITLGFSLMMDLYILIVSGLTFSEFFTASLIIFSLLNVVLTIMTYNLFSVYTTGNKFQIVGLLVIGFGAIPGWYKNLPFERVLYYFNFILPPLGNNIVLQQNNLFLSWNLLRTIIYLLITSLLGIKLFSERNLSDLE